MWDLGLAGTALGVMPMAALPVYEAQFVLGLNPASILGIIMAVSGVGLYFLRSVRPELARDYDPFFAAVGLLCGVILLTQGWRLDPILQFSQFLLAASTGFFAWESIRLRGIATAQAKRNTPIVDEDRPVSRSYKAVIDEDDFPVASSSRAPRMRNSRSSRSAYLDEDEREVSPRPKLRGSSADRSSERSARRRSRSDSDDMGDRSSATLDRSPRRLPRRSVDETPPRSTPTASLVDDEYSPSRRRKSTRSSDVRRSAQSSARSSAEEYVDYQPLDYSTGSRYGSGGDESANDVDDRINQVSDDLEQTSSTGYSNPEMDSEVSEIGSKPRRSSAAGKRKGSNRSSESNWADDEVDNSANFVD